MNTLRNSLAVLGLATLGLSLFAALPANAQAPRFVRHDQYRQAMHLDHQAAQAASFGDYRRAARLRRQAAHLRAEARHGF